MAHLFRRFPIALACMSAILLACSLPLFSQIETATISGTITDQTGAVVTGADVKLTNVLTGITSSTTSNGSGLYVFPSVPPSLYRMMVAKAGFKQVVLTDLTVNVQDALSRNFRLQLGVVGESITVSGENVGIDTESATVSTVVDQQFVENLPLNGRSFQSLIYLMPGVTFFEGGNDNASFTTNGQRVTSNYFTIDGVSANIGTSSNNYASGVTSGTDLGGDANGNTNGMVSLDAMQEFRIQTSSFAPEFGRTPGGQVSITTKSGGNQWHGTAFEYLRNTIFDARNTFNPSPQPQPAEHMNNFGGTFSGPILKNKAFFFFSYEEDRLLQPQFLGNYFLTAASRATVSTAWMPFVNADPLPPTNGAMLAEVDPNTGDPVTCDNVTIPCYQQYALGQSYPSNSRAFSLRLDHNLTKKLTVFVRSNYAPSYLASVQYNLFSPTNTHIDTETVGATYTISPTMVNDLRANWSQSDNATTFVMQSTYSSTPLPAGTLLFPPDWGWNTNNANAQFSFSTEYNPVIFNQGPTYGQFAGISQSQWNIVDTLSKNVGTHQLKFGVDWRRMLPTNGPSNSFLVFADTWHDLVNGMTPEVSYTAEKKLTYSMNNWSFYGQDTWKVTPKLNLTYGLRWDINPAPVSVTPGLPTYAIDGIFNSNPLALVQRPLWNTQWTALAPRIGAAYAFTKKTVLRGGFGLFNDIGFGSALGHGVPYETGLDTFSVDANGNGIIPFDLNSSNAAYQIPTFSNIIDSSSLWLQAVDPNLKTPFTLQWNVAVEHSLGTSQTITATYVGSDGQRLIYSPTVNSFNGGYGFATTNKGYSHYNSLQFSYTARMAHSLQAMVNYTYSRSSDLASSIFIQQTFADVQSIVLPPLSPSDYDVPNNLQAMVSYSIPKPTWGGAPAKWILGGWGLDGTYHYQSGLPVSVRVNVPFPGFGYTAVYADRVPGQPIWIPAPAGIYAPAGKVLNPAAFTPPPPGVYFGTSGRNQIRNPYGMDDTDLSLRRQFDVTNRVKLTLRMDFFNLLNHPMFAQGLSVFPVWGICPSPTTCYQFPQFGTMDFAVTMNQGSTAQAAMYAPGNNRNGQLSIKLLF